MTARDELAGLNESIRESAAYGLRFAAEQQHLSLHAVDVDWVASVIARHSLTAAENSGEMVPRKQHDEEVERLKRRASMFENWWAGSQVSADQQLQRMQVALSELSDQDLARSLAEKVGVLLLEVDDALFEAAK